MSKYHEWEKKVVKVCLHSSKAISLQFDEFFGIKIQNSKISEFHFNFPCILCIFQFSKCLKINRIIFTYFARNATNVQIELSE